MSWGGVAGALPGFGVKPRGALQMNMLEGVVRISLENFTPQNKNLLTSPTPKKRVVKQKLRKKKLEIKVAVLFKHFGELHIALQHPFNLF